jgi:hypothetical protein
MTRARLAAEAEGGQLDDDLSIHSSGTRLSLGSGDHYGGTPSQSNEFNYHTNHGGWPYQQGRPQQQQQMKMQAQMHQMQAPNSHSPHYSVHTHSTLQCVHTLMLSTLQCVHTHSTLHCTCT